MLATPAACTGGQTGDESTGRSADPAVAADAGRDAGSGQNFLDSIMRSFGSYDAATSAPMLAERSERIAVGRLRAVRRGRDVLLGRGGYETAIMELAVSETLKGEPADTLYVELYTGFVFDGPTLPQPLPDNRLLVFLIPSYFGEVDGDAGMVAIEGVPEGEALHTPTTPQGLVIEDEDGIAHAPAAEFFSGPFDVVVEMVRDAVH